MHCLESKGMSLSGSLSLAHHCINPWDKCQNLILRKFRTRFSSSMIGIW
jgi:hypothetical protein